MASSVVIFGPPHAGKSTLAGYIHAKLTPGFDLRRFIEKVRQEIGGKYDPSLKFAYIQDTHRDERLRRYTAGSVGTSYYMHTDRIPIKDDALVVIDTPGAGHAIREQMRGMFLGDVGVFMVELKRFVSRGLLDQENEAILAEFFAPFFTWRDFGPERSEAVILVSKIDQHDFSEGEFKKAVRVINAACGKAVSRLHILPIAIEVDKERDHNVITKSDSLGWHSGLTFQEALEEISVQQARKATTDSPFVCIRKQYDLPAGMVLEGKVLEGTIYPGMSVLIAPAQFHNRGYEAIGAKIGTIRFLGQETDVEKAGAGSFVAFIASHLRLNNRSCKKSEIDLPETTCVFPSSEAGVIGNCLEFEIKADRLPIFRLLAPVAIPWFGRMVAGKVVNVRSGDREGRVTVELDALHAALPLNADGKLRLTHFLLKTEMDFVPATLLALGGPGCVTCVEDRIAELHDDISDYFQDYQFTVLPNQIRFECGGRGIAEILAKVKRFLERRGQDGTDIAAKVVIELGPGRMIGKAANA